MLKNFFYFFHWLFVFVLYPASAIVFAVVFLLTNTDFYVQTLKRIDFLPSYIEAVNEKNNTAFTQKLEGDPELINAKQQQEGYLSSLTLSETYLENISRQEELDLLNIKKRELKNLRYAYAPSRFPDEASFEESKKNELANMEALAKKIKKQQSENRREIMISKQNIQKLRRQYQSATGKVQNLENKIRKEFISKENSFSGKLHSDMAKLTPEFNRTFNDLFLEKSVRENITRYLYFLTHYQEDKEENKIYDASFANSSQVFSLPDVSLQSLRVHFPDVRMSFLTEQEHNGVLQKRHIFRDILFEKVSLRQDLQKTQLIKTILLNLDSYLVTSFLNKKLTKYNFAFNGEVLQNLKPIELQGEPAVTSEKLIRIFSQLYFFRYLLAALPFIFLFSLWLPSVNRRYKLWCIFLALFVPSLLLSLVSLGLLFYGKNWLLLVPALVNITQNVFNLNMLNAVSHAILYGFLTPLILFWLANMLVAVGFKKIYLKKIRKQKTVQAAEKSVD